MQEKFDSALKFLTDWLNEHVLTWNTAGQWACVIGSYLLTALFWKGFEKRLFKWVDDKFKGELVRSVLHGLVDLGNIVVFIVFMQIAASIFWTMGLTPVVLNAASDLAAAWIVIRLVTSLMPNRTLARGVAVTIWALAALNIFGLLSPITDFLGKLSIPVGETSFSALDAIKGVLLSVVLLQAAAITSQFASKRIESVKDLSPSIRVLLTKAVKILLFAGAVLFALSSVGIDLTALAIFSSALGVGIGFGLKTVFSNYVAGILLLLDRSIKPGDTIEVGNVFGVVRDMHGRYASVLTRDGTEHLIPNERLIANPVVNWTYSDDNVRLKLPIGIGYDSDVDKALELLIKATDGVGRVLRDPAPVARLVGFGDNSIDLQLRLWIADADRGLSGVRSQVLLNAWHLFNEHGIELPFPQREVLLKQDSKLAVTIDKEGGSD